MLFVLVVAFLVLIQPKVGGAILILVIGSVLIFSASIHAKFSVIAAGIVVASAALLSKIIIFLGDHQYLPHFFAHVYDRLVVLKNPFLSFHDRGFQPSMAYLAMYNGGFWGTGLANGMVKRWLARRSNRFYLCGDCGRTWFDWRLTITISFVIFSGLDFAE